MIGKRKDVPPWWYEDALAEEVDCDEFDWADQAPNAEQILIAAESFRGEPERRPPIPPKGGR